MKTHDNINDTFSSVWQYQQQREKCSNASKTSQENRQKDKEKFTQGDGQEIGLQSEQTNPRRARQVRRSGLGRRKYCLGRGRKQPLR